MQSKFKWIDGPCCPIGFSPVLCPIRPLGFFPQPTSIGSPQPLPPNFPCSIGNIKD